MTDFEFDAKVKDIGSSQTEKGKSWKVKLKDMEEGHTVVLRFIDEVQLKGLNIGNIVHILLHNPQTTLDSVAPKSEEKKEVVPDLIQYKDIKCSECDESTSHVLVDLSDGSGQGWQCEICGTFNKPEEEAAI